MLTIRRLEKDEGGTRVTVDRRLYLTSDRSRLVKEGDKEAAFLYCTAGEHMPCSELRAFGVKVSKFKPEAKADEPKAKQDKDKPEDKADKAKTTDKGK